MTSGRPSGDRPVECERLAETLRALRTRTGLSLAALAAKTPYSKSSWDRYLRGTTVPPRQAVAALCELAGEHPGRALALWELADAVASGRAASGRTAAGRAGVGRTGGGRTGVGRTGGEHARAEAAPAGSPPPPGEAGHRPPRRLLAGIAAWDRGRGRRDGGHAGGHRSVHRVRPGSAYGTVPVPHRLGEGMPRRRPARARTPSRTAAERIPCR